jgi:hypothetical protein
MGRRRARAAAARAPAGPGDRRSLTRRGVSSNARTIRSILNAASTFDGAPRPSIRIRRSTIASSRSMARRFTSPFGPPRLECRVRRHVFGTRGLLARDVTFPDQANPFPPLAQPVLPEVFSSPDEGRASEGTNARILWSPRPPPRGSPIFSQPLAATRTLPRTPVEASQAVPGVGLGTGRRYP